MFFAMSVFTYSIKKLASIFTFIHNSNNKFHLIGILFEAFLKIVIIRKTNNCIQKIQIYYFDDDFWL